VANRGSRTVYYCDDCSPVDVTLYAVLPTGESARIAPGGFCTSPPQCCAPLAPAAGFQGSATFDGTLHTALGTRVATPGEYTLVARFAYTYQAPPVSLDQYATIERRKPFSWSVGPTP
jgi:hypothetical protein